MHQFQSKPQSVEPRTKKYRFKQSNQWGDAQDVPVSNSIMNDPRVVRGSTYAARIISQAQREDEERLARQARMHSKRASQARRRKKSVRTASPEPVPGRSHMYSQTDEYLEVLVDRPPEKEATTQTDALMDRPPSPLFRPAKIGVDKSTQIEPGDLFNFNVEVEPILEVLVGKTLEQAMDEVLEEEELANIRKHKAAFEQQRNIELAEVQRLEAEERRKAAEKERRVAQENNRVRQEEEVMEKVAARGFAKNYLADLHSAVFDKLVGTGHFFDPVEREVNDVFMPWLHKATANCLGQINAARELASELVVAALTAQQAHQSKYAAWVAEEEERIRALEVLRAEEAAAAAAAAAEAEEDE